MYRVGSCSSGSDPEDDIWIKQTPENNPLLRTLHPYTPKPLTPRNRLSTPSCTSLVSVPPPPPSSRPEVDFRRTRKACSETGSDVIAEAETSGFRRRARGGGCAVSGYRNSAFEPGFDLELELDRDLETGNGDAETEKTNSSSSQVKFSPNLSRNYSRSCDCFVAGSELENPAAPPPPPPSSAGIDLSGISRSGRYWIRPQDNSPAVGPFDFACPRAVPEVEHRGGKTVLEKSDFSSQSNTGFLAFNQFQRLGAEIRTYAEPTRAGSRSPGISSSSENPSGSSGMNSRTKGGVRAMLSLPLKGINCPEGDNEAEVSDLEESRRTVINSIVITIWCYVDYTESIM